MFRKRNKWVKVGYYYEYPRDTKQKPAHKTCYQCTNCGQYNKYATPYCPYCGKKMKGIEHETN